MGVPSKFGYPNLEVYFRATDSWEPCECSLAHSSALQLDAHCLERTSDTRNAARGMLQPPACATAHHTRTPSCFRCQQISRVGAPCTRLHPVCHALRTRPAKPTSTRPSPVPRPHAAAATAASLLEADADHLGHRSQARRCQSADQIIGTRSLVSEVDAGDVVDYDAVQR